VKDEMSFRILRSLPREKAFYFFTSIGNYTGESASSLKEFAEKINEVNIKSLEFHLYRRDFEKWIDETLEDKELAVEIRSLRSLNYSGTMLKEHLYSLVAKRYGKLSGNFKVV
jgi:hypothetical protein